MSTGMIWQIRSIESVDTENLGEVFGRHLTPPAILELRADLGGGKTTFVRGLARGLGSSELVSSPTFTLSRIYETDKVQLHHYDFYRLNDAGVLTDQLSESLANNQAITVVEWGNIVQDVLPESRISIEFKPTANDPDEREITVKYLPEYEGVVRAVETDWQEVKP